MKYVKTKRDEEDTNKTREKLRFKEKGKSEREKRGGGE